MSADRRDMQVLDFGWLLTFSFTFYSRGHQILVFSANPRALPCPTSLGNFEALTSDFF
jgi:hypothetical protein